MPGQLLAENWSSLARAATEEGEIDADQARDIREVGDVIFVVVAELVRA